jgi:hypothetical protein
VTDIGFVAKGLGKMRIIPGPAGEGEMIMVDCWRVVFRFRDVLKVWKKNVEG